MNLKISTLSFIFEWESLFSGLLIPSFKIISSSHWS
uniref:Uncharacterized protein n=1 Tax=Cryptosporidium parvum TaxID=5807 RepID=F0X525_CRYPV